jgi:hypothetical protein
MFFTKQNAIPELLDTYHSSGIFKVIAVGNIRLFGIFNRTLEFPSLHISNQKIQNRAGAVISPMEPAFNGIFAPKQYTIPDITVSILVNIFHP